MHVHQQIRRGVERCIASNEAARLEGLYGLSGLSGPGDNFDYLEDYLNDVGFAGAKDHVKLLRRRCDVVSNKMIAAVPVAQRAMQLMEENDSQLGSIFSKIGKAIKKVGKVAVKLSPSHMLIKKIKPLKKISPAFRVAEGNTPLIQAAVGPPPPTDPAVIAQMKADADAAAALKAAQVPSGTPPVAAGAAVLANSAGVNLSTDQAALLAQQVAANLQQPGSVLPTASMFSSPPSASADPNAPASDSGSLLSNPWVLGGIGVLVVGGFLMMRKKR